MAIKYIIDNDEVRTWVEDHGGVPVVLKGVVEGGEESPDMLHLAFGKISPDMEEMDWEEFAERFENEKLALAYDEDREDEIPPNFELIDRDRAREEYAPETELPDSGDMDVLLENTGADDDAPAE